MKVIEAKNPVHWTNKGFVDLEVLFEGFKEFIPFTANPKDSEEHGYEIYQRALSGEFGEVEEKVFVEPTNTRPNKPSTENVLEALLKKVEELEAKLEEMK